MGWTLSCEAKRLMENSLIATTRACNAGENIKAIDAIVERLERRSRVGERPALELAGMRERASLTTLRLEPDERGRRTFR